MPLHLRSVRRSFKARREEDELDIPAAVRVRLGFVPPTWRRAFVAVHRVLAAALVALAGANCILGAILLESTFGGGGPTLAAAIALLVLWALAWAAAEALGLPGRRASHGEYSVARADGAQLQPNPLSDIPEGL